MLLHGFVYFDIVLYCTYFFVSDFVLMLNDDVQDVLVIFQIPDNISHTVNIYSYK